jgi:DNA-directed RNA polymerase
MDLREQQLKLEVEADVEAAATKLVALQDAAASGDVNTSKAQRLIARLYSDVAGFIDTAKAQRSAGTAAKYRNWLRAVPSDLAAVISIREVISQCGNSEAKDVTVQRLATNIGKAFILETRIKEAELVNPLYMKRVHDQVQEHATTDRRHLQTLYNTAYAKVFKDEAVEPLSTTEALQLGKYGLQACMDAGLCELVKTVGSKGLLYYYQLTPDISEFLNTYTAADVRSTVDKDTGAMHCPPDPWTSLLGGGYISNRRKANAPLMSLTKVRRNVRAELVDQFTAEKMPMVFDCANYLQSIAYTVHQPTYEAIQRLWTMGGGMLGVPEKNAPVKPECPLPETWVAAEGTPDELRAFHAWKFKATQYYDSLRIWRAKVREIAGFMKHVRLAGGPIWFPVFMDTRGRWYYRGSPNPQGYDLAKACLHFNEKKPLGATGVYWLRVHIANCYGFDKGRFDERAAWTVKHWDLIERAIDHPEDHLDVWGTDAPWCMYSAAVELRNALRMANPAEYCTGIPIHMDATCSGLQHFSAMLRDPQGGMYVNLFDQGEAAKQDIYAKVAETALAAMQSDLNSKTADDAAMAAWWLKSGIPRSLAKKPVMTYCYGATLRGVSTELEVYIHDNNLDVPDTMRHCDISLYAARKLFHGIASIVPSAEATMQWLKSVAKSKPNGVRMVWTSPTGFKVQHDYQDYEDKRIKIRSCGIVQTVIKQYTDGTRKVPMGNAISPNFVHALDASHLTLTALAMQKLGLSMVGIHDSFGTHPCDVTVIHSVIRSEFVSMYKDNSVLNEFLWEVDGVGNPPMKGTLDLSKVVDSEFFFC